MTQSTGIAHKRRRAPTEWVLAACLVALLPASSFGLGFEALVDCRMAVEEVAWRHRLWPAENPHPKPPLETQLTRDEMAGRVDDMLRRAQLLAERWGRPIEASSLGAELNRMAQQTRDPAVLRELFAAAGDGEHAALCLALPALVERWQGSSYASDDELHGELRRKAEWAASQPLDIETLADDGAHIEEVVYRLDDEKPRGWRAEETARAIRLDRRELAELEAHWPAANRPKSARRARGPTGWTRLVAGERTPLEETDAAFVVREVRDVEDDRLVVVAAVWPKVPFETWWKQQAHRYGPADIDATGVVLPKVAVPAACPDDSWTPTAVAGFLPAPRFEHTAVWTGSEMIVWGGANEFGELGGFAGGARYTPATDTWAPTSPAAAPAARSRHTAIWTGTEMIVWGGLIDVLQETASGGRYRPTTNTWSSTTLNGAPGARESHTAVWTGTEMIIWGGIEGIALPADGKRYVPNLDTWLPLTAVGQPSARFAHGAVWTGAKMIVWGGSNGFFALADGGVYDPGGAPGTDSWSPMAATPAGVVARAGHSAVWTGGAMGEMIIWGGDGDAGELGSGGRYRLSNNSWTEVSTAGAAPSARGGHSAVWTGNRMLIWGGRNPEKLASGGRYNPGTDGWAAITGSGAPTPRSEHTAVWTGTEMIVWGGMDANLAVASGGRYSPAANQWVPTSASASTPGTAEVRAVWTGLEMIVYEGGGSATRPGARYVPATDQWTPISRLNSPEPRGASSLVWTGTKMIAWGGRNSVGDLNTGGLYAPISDSWSATSTAAGVPDGRARHTAIWTGSRMIVWGGSQNLISFLQSGGSYDPEGNAWTPLPTLGAPSPRAFHTAVWTGTQMIVWGGENNAEVHFTGGRYTPLSNSWSDTSLAGAPVARAHHTAVWTGRQMIVWGGFGELGDLASGGLYTPNSNTWSPTALLGAPEERSFHSAVWTGQEMIVWGGGLATGGRYRPGKDRWSPTTLLGAPAPRAGHTAVWTGSEMIVWGGNSGPTGGRYCVTVLFADGFETDEP